MATHSSILAQRIPWTEEPGGLESMGLHRVGHDCVTRPPVPKAETCMNRASILDPRVAERVRRRLATSPGQRPQRNLPTP